MIPTHMRGGTLEHVNTRSDDSVVNLNVSLELYPTTVSYLGSSRLHVHTQRPLIKPHDSGEK